MNAIRSLLFLVVVALAGPVAAQDAASSEPAAEAAPPGAEQAKMLVDLLKDDAARAALIERLEAAAQATKAAEEPEPAGVMTQIAQRTKQVAERLGALVDGTIDAVAELRALADGDTDTLLGGTTAILKDLALLMAVTLVLFLVVLRPIASWLFVRLADRAHDAGWLRTASLLAVSVVIDALSAVGAWAAGHGVALWLGESGSIAVSQTLFLNAFLVIELVKVVLRAVLAPRFADLRLLPLSDESAAYWGFWLSRLVSLLGYGLMLVVPLIANRISPDAGKAVGLLIALTALVIVVLIVLQNRASVRGKLEARASRASGRLEAMLLTLTARTWHLAAILYALALFMVWSVSPEDGAAWMARATVESLVAIGIGVFVNRFIARWVTGGIRITDDLRERLPLLEQRLNAYVPAILRVVRFAISACVVLALFQIWELADVAAWLQEEAGREVALRLVSAFLIAVAALAIYLGVSSWVEYRLNPNFGLPPTAREKTLLSLFRNAFTIALVIIGSMLVLAQLGVNIGPLLAGAGVLGLAIGFGAQKLVQDVITGAFIQFENAMNAGDVVTVGGITGVVERLTIRSVALRDVNGVYHVVPFSSADSVSNFMHGFSYHVAEIGVAYRENIAEVKQLMAEAFDRLKETEHGQNLIGDFEMHGVTQFADSAVVVRARLKCLPGKQWAAGRAYNEIIKELFDERGIEIPFPHVTLYMGEDKEGHSPPLNVRGALATGSGGSNRADDPADSDDSDDAKASQDTDGSDGASDADGADGSGDPGNPDASNRPRDSS